MTVRIGKEHLWLNRSVLEKLEGQPCEFEAYLALALATSPTPQTVEIDGGNVTLMPGDVHIEFSHMSTQSWVTVPDGKRSVELHGHGFRSIEHLAEMGLLLVKERFPGALVVAFPNAEVV